MIFRVISKEGYDRIENKFRHALMIVYYSHIPEIHFLARLDSNMNGF